MAHRQCSQVRSPLIPGPMTTVDRYLLDEAALIERRIARLRIQLILGIGVALGLYANFARLKGAVPSMVVGALWLAAAIAVDRVLAHGAYRRWISAAAIIADATFLTAVVLVIDWSRGEPAFGPGAVHTFLYFPLVAMAALRQSRGLALLGGATSATGYLLLFAVTLAFDPASVAMDDSASARVSVIRAIITVAAMLTVAWVGMLLSSRSHRLLASALDTRSFLFADLRDFTDFVERQGDAAASELIRVYRILVRAQIARTGGGEVKTEGDSFYVVFDSARQALACGVGIQRAAASTSTPDRPIRVGIGLHAGEPVPHDGQFVGSAVNVAARLAQSAAAGELLCSDVVRGLLRTSDVPPMRERAVTMKGISDPPRAYEVIWRE